MGTLSGAEGQAAVESMVHALRHRGPDGRDLQALDLGAGRRLFLGHARLSILDLSDHAAQPMRDAATDSWLIYNGEIFNFRTLRAELEALGHRFESTGDTEVLLKALVQWGVQALPRLRGMYALAFWDGRARRLWLGRDPFGIKPLLIGRSGSTIIFGSELRCLQAAGLLEPAVNPTAIRSYLAFGAVIEPATIQAHVVALPPGHVIAISPDGDMTTPQKVISLGDVRARHPRPAAMSFAQAKARTRAALHHSVQEHLISDVPVGIFLSGGIDSSLVAALANQGAVARDLRYLTVCFPDQEFSELGYARQVASRLSGRHEVVQLDAEQLAAFLPRALASLDQPSVDGVNTFIVSGVAAQQGIKVVLSGLGGDELFGGYTTFWKTPLLRRYRHVLKLVARLAPRRLFRSESERRKLTFAGECADPRDAYLLQRALRWDGRLAGIASFGSLADSARAMPEAWDNLAMPRELDDYSQVSYMEASFYMRNQLLHDSDIMSSAHSIELRVPFLDLDVLEAAWSIPGEHHVSGRGRGKKLLKSILNDLMPGLPLERPKMGFVFPWKKWLREPPVSALLTEVFETSALYRGTGVEPQEGRAILHAFQRGDPLINWLHVWSLFVLLHWQRRFATTAKTA